MPCSLSHIGSQIHCRFPFCAKCAFAREERLQIAETEDDALKQMRLDELHRREFGRWDRSLDRLLCGPKWLSQPAVAQIVVENLHHFDGQRYDLDAYFIMPNHVHLLMQPRPKDDGEFYSLAKIMHSMKSFTAHAANRILGRQGRFWQPEFYDRVVRSDAEWERIVRYILNNPVKAGLVGEQDDWRWSYYSGRR